MTGVSWIGESGTMSGPVCLTNTHAVGIAHQAVVRWTSDRHPEVAEGWLLPVVGETWDGYLNDTNGEHLTVDHVIAAIEGATSGPVDEGSVGGGTGMSCYHSHFSGDLFVAMTVADPGAITPGYQSVRAEAPERYNTMRYVPWGFMDPLFEAVAQATEEAILDALVANEEMVGYRGHRSPALPRDRVVALLRERGTLV
jgi:L-aminopeptidase/D-esterase-like protein